MNALYRSAFCIIGLLAVSQVARADLDVKIRQVFLFTQSDVNTFTEDSGGISFMVDDPDTSHLVTGGSALITALPAGSTETPPISDNGNFGNGSVTYYSWLVLWLTHAELLAAYPSGNYTFQVPVIGGPASITATLFGPTTDIPRVTNTGWSGGQLLYDPTQDFTITWTQFAGADADDDIILQNFGPTYFDTTLAPTATSYTIAANTYSLGTSSMGQNTRHLSLVSHQYSQWRDIDRKPCRHNYSN